MSTYPHRLRCEYKENPLGIDVLAPRLSWQMHADARDVVQTAYQVQVADTPEALAAGQGLLWDSGKVVSDASIHIVYQGPALRSAQRCYWRVRVWDNADQPTPWSDDLSLPRAVGTRGVAEPPPCAAAEMRGVAEPPPLRAEGTRGGAEPPPCAAGGIRGGAFWEMGLLQPGDWRANWIEPDWDEDPQVSQPCPYLRAGFAIHGPVQSARVYVTAHGLYELTVNGQPVTDDLFTPGFTAYQKRLQYQTCDVTALLRPGDNAVGVILGDGWWRGKIGAASVRNAYGTRLALLMQMRILYQDGSEQWVVSDGQWKASTGPILSSDMKDGEVYDARREMPGWDMPSWDDSGWRGVRIADYGVANLVAPAGVPVRRHEEIRPVQVIHTPAGETVVDMGQNFAGRVRLRVRGPAGATVTLRHGEALDKAGNFTMANLNLPGPVGGGELLQQVTYTLKGEDEEIYEPRFTFHGFRYVRVEGFPGEPTPEDLTGIAIYSDMAPAGTFTCSNPMVNQLQSNIAWSQKSNFLDIPTDCPQRERAGWTGDAQIFCRTGSFIMDMAAFLTKWLQDLAAEQHADGLVTNLVPDAFKGAGGFMARLEGSAGWGDAAVIIPWTMYLCYGDVRILHQQYASMKAWVDFQANRAAHVHWARKLEPSYWLSKARRARQPYIWDTGYHWGEWLEPGTSTPAIAVGMFKRVLLSEPAVATPYLAYSSGLLARIARLLGKEEDTEAYRALHDKVKAAYVAEFVRPQGTQGIRIRPDRQASYVRALAFDLLPESMRPLAARRLVELVRQNGNHLGTGFLSTTYLCHVLTSAGYLDVAYDLLNQTTVPSWLYPITKGATSIWETWDGIKEDGTPSMSLNHYSYGAVGSWLYQVVAGIDGEGVPSFTPPYNRIDAPAYKHSFIQPQPGGGLTQARATYESMYGLIVSGWEHTGGRMVVEVTIPPNTSATVRLPDARADQVTEGDTALAAAAGVHHVQQAGSATVFDLGSGQYRFEYPAPVPHVPVTWEVTGT